jgi:hypothetical protein
MQALDTIYFQTKMIMIKPKLTSLSSIFKHSLSARRVPVRRVYDNVVSQRHRQGNSGTDSDNSLPDFPSLPSNLNRKRAEFYPPIPQTIHQVAILIRELKRGPAEHFCAIRETFGEF